MAAPVWRIQEHLPRWSIPARVGKSVGVARATHPSLRWLPWLGLIVWLGVALLGGPAVSSALDSRSTSVRVVTIGGTWACWAIAAVAFAVWSTVSLTVIRSLVPLSVVAGVMAWVAGAPAGESSLLLAFGAVATVLTTSAEFGAPMIQASAYGDETRLALRPPFGFAVVTVATWMLTAGLVLSGPLLVAANVDGSTPLLLLGALLAAAAIAALWIFPRRWQLLSRRWLVFVPAGVVVHDRLVLAETAMLRRTEVAGLALALVGTGALDLTGPATGHAVEIDTTTPVTVLLAPARRGDVPRPVDALALLVSPTRPGRALAEADRRRLTVRTR